MGIEQVGANWNGSNGSFTVSLWVNGSTTTIINNGRDSQYALPRQAFSVDQEKSVGQLGLNTGIPRVGFSHTVPVPVYTVTRCG